MGAGASLPSFINGAPKSEFKKNFDLKYVLLSDLGNGAFSVVKRGANKVINYRLISRLLVYYYASLRKPMKNMPLKS